MEKYKVYLDTSVISYLQQEDAPEKMVETLKLWNKFKSNEFDIYLSQVTLDEISKCDDSKLEYLQNKLKEINYEVLPIEDTTYNLANKIIDKKILTEKSYDDCTHIAVALENNCDIILSWNFKH